MSTAKQIQQLLNLRPLPVEGGYFAETYRSKFALTQQALPSGYRGERALSSAIYYMLTPDTFSAIHRLKGDEVYHFYLGDPAEMLVLQPEGAGEVKRVVNAEIRQYFESRYDQASEAMRATMGEPILNKTSAFTADPHFRHIVGQEHSTFSLKQAMDEGQWVIVDLNKGMLGEQSLTLGSLIFTMLKNALFTRERRALYTIYCDEIQNLVPYSGGGIETVLSEARKFGVGIVAANQFLDQHPPEVRAALLAVGSHVFFQLSAADAGPVTQALDGGGSLAYRLKNLPQRHCIVKVGPEHWTEVQIPVVLSPEADYTDLLNRSRYARSRVRAHIEREIAQRHELAHRKTDDILHAWE